MLYGPSLPHSLLLYTLRNLVGREALLSVDSEALLEEKTDELYMMLLLSMPC